MGSNKHTPWTSTSKFSTADMTPPLSDLDKAITYSKQAIIHCDGDIEYNSTTGVLSWGGTLRVLFCSEAGDAIQNTVATGNITVADNQFVYLDLNETDGTVLTASVAVVTTDAASNFLADNRLVLGYRNTTSDEFYPVALRQYLGASGSGGGHVIMDEGSGLTQRTNLDFVGSGVVVTDDSGNDKTIVTVSGSGGGASTLASVDRVVMGEHFGLDYTTTVGSTSAYAFKGNFFTLRENITMYGVGGILRPAVAGANYKAILVTVDGSSNIGTVVASSPVYTVPAGQNNLNPLSLWFWFSTPADLTSGTDYAVLIGRTDSTNTYALPVIYPGNAYPLPFNSDATSAGNYGARVAKAAPAAGDAVDTSYAGTVGLVYAFSNDSAEIRVGTPVVNTLTYSATIAVDYSDGDVQDVTLTGNPTINLSGANDGALVTLRIKQDATGSRTVTWGTMVRFSTDVPQPTLSTAANTLDYLTFRYNEADSKYDCMSVNKGF